VLRHQTFLEFTASKLDFSLILLYAGAWGGVSVSADLRISSGEFSIASMHH
jgi:hypothetical protein